jgi:ribonucleoside-diphosphate reductase alpha chain
VAGVRRYMSRRRSGRTTTVTIDNERFCITANQRGDGSLGEVFIHWGKHGSSGAGLVSMYATALSIDWLPYPDRECDSRTQGP